MSSANEFGKTLDELRAQIVEMQAVAEARKLAVYKVLNALGDFATPERAVNGADLVDTCRELYNELLATPGLQMDLTPRVMRLDDGSFRTSQQDIVDSLDEAGIFFGHQPLDRNETLVDLALFDTEPSSEQVRG